MLLLIFGPDYILQNPWIGFEYVSVPLSIKFFDFSIWGGPRVRKGTLATARTYTDGTIFHTSDADTDFPDDYSKTVDKDTYYLKNHGITDTCPTMKIYNNEEELRTYVGVTSQDNLKLLMSCYCKYSFKLE